MTGFYSVMRNLQEDYKTYSQNYSKEALELLSKSTDFINAVEAVRTLDSIRRINDEGIDELTELSRTISQLYHLRPKIEETEDEKNYAFKDGVLSVDLRNTELPLYEIFEQLFPETNYSNDKDFYRKIAVYCLGAESSDKSGGEYKVNLKNDYDDTTREDAIFGRLMREKYISERYMKDGEAGRKKGAALLKQFDARHGTLITKSEKNTYAKNNIATIIRAADFINSTLSKGLPFPLDKVRAMPLSLFTWYRRLRKAVLEITDKSKMTDTEKIELMRAIYDLKLRHPVLSALAEILPAHILKPLLQNNTYEAELAQKCSACIKPFGVTYAGAEKDYYYTLENSLHLKFGFMDAYDESGDLLGMDLQDTVIVFPYKDKEYRVEFWCGRYAYGNAYGAEIGIYYRPLSDALEKPYREKEKDSRFIYYECVPEGEQFGLKLTIKDKSGIFRKIENDVSDYDKNGDHFWNLAIRTSKLPIDRMYVEGIIKSNDTQVMQCMRKAIKERNMKILFEKPNSVSVAIKE